jgi:hypothetical protein
MASQRRLAALSGAGPDVSGPEWASDIVETFDGIRQQDELGVERSPPGPAYFRARSSFFQLWVFRRYRLAALDD